MQYSKFHKLLLIENPCVGNSAFSAATKMARVADPYVLPTTESRKSLEVDFDTAEKVVIVRDSVDRFLTGCTRALRGDVDPAGDFSEFLKPLKPENAALNIAQFIEASGFDAVPSYFKPQVTWLSCKFDLILASHNLAEYFTRVLKVSQGRLNMSALTPGPRAHIRPGVESAVLALYAEDVKRFETLRVWSPKPDEVRLVSGYCATCSAALKVRKVTPQPEKSAPISDPSAEVELPTLKFSSARAEELYSDAISSGGHLPEEFKGQGTGEGGRLTASNVRDVIALAKVSE